MPTNGRWRVLIIVETIVLAVLLGVLAALLIFAMFKSDRVGLSWFSVGIAAAGVMGEIVRRFRHLRTDLASAPRQNVRVLQ